MPRPISRAEQDSFRDSREAMCQSLLKRELKLMGARKIYILNDNDARGVFDGCRGVTSRWMCLDHRGLIGDRWRGPGPCVYLNTLTLTNRTSALERLTATLIHELGHVFQYPITPNQYRPRKFRRFAKEHAAIRETIPKQVHSYEDAGDSRLMAWQCSVHGASWIRPLLHVVQRAEQAGWKFSRSDLCDWNLIGFTDCDGYELLLANELRELADIPLTTLLDVAADEAFIEQCKLREDDRRDKWAQHVADEQDALAELKEIMSKRDHWNRVQKALKRERVRTWFA